MFGYFEANPVVFIALVGGISWLTSAIRDRVRLIIARRRAAKLGRPGYL